MASPTHVATVCTLICALILPPFFAPSLVDFTQRTYTFCSDRAEQDFGYALTESVYDSIKRLVAEEGRRLPTGAGVAGPAAP